MKKGEKKRKLVGGEKIRKVEKREGRIEIQRKKERKGRRLEKKVLLVLNYSATLHNLVQHKLMT